jgi:hypothetical protein
MARDQDQDEPRTTASIVQDLLDLLYETEWVLFWDDRRNEHWRACGHCTNRKKEGHAPACPWVLHTKKAEAFVAVEREVQEL